MPTWLDLLDRAGARLGPFAGRLRWFPEVPSTNDVARSMAEEGGEEGLVIVADSQTAGRGRLGRGWASPSGAGLYVSVVLRPSTEVAALLTIAAGVAIAEGIEAATGLAPSLKWPNDLYVGPRKLGGILAERGGGHVVLGFGINVVSGSFPPDVAARATSLESELGCVCDRGQVLVECLAALASRYDDLWQQRTGSVVAAWRARATSTFGATIAWDMDGTPHAGVVVDVADDGALIVDTEAGRQRKISGEVRWV